ncbi:YhgE/Pip family protein [Agromyces albus]|uniref:YhgE/Pip domain-containing protein n=1 Tax=Agromyces albus TaxID=205332 RepID=A0A4Q2KWT9_9MICO|nr:YhgE/Pip family protein [Agromyces albus]RXZ69367.1 YhgE/Pip domain-containing protein [Agromyces albus]
MSSRLQPLLGTTPAQRRVRYGALLAAVIVVPLAVAGLFSGALGGSGDRLDTIPAVVVNNDEMVTMTGTDGTEQPVLAGRQLVTELTGPASTGFDWSISNDEEAAELLASGDAYAVLTVPADFSESVTSLAGEAPTRAQLDIRTDDAHGYLAGSVAQSVGDAMTAAFGRELTARYLEGFYSNLASLGGSLGDAATGATELSSGVGSLAGGLGELSTGVASAASGAADAASGAYAYADGVGEYTSGVDSLAGGLGQLQQQAGGLDGLTSGTAEYVTNVHAAADGFDALAAGLAPLLEADPSGAAAQSVAEYAAGLDQLAAGGDLLVTKTGEGVDQLQGGIDEIGTGAAQLAGGSEQLRSGADGLANGVDSLASGLGELSRGTADAASGATQLADGAGSLASGLTRGAESASALTDIDAATTADVVSEPVVVDAARDHEIDSTGEVIGMLFVPIGLWIGAMAMFLVFRPFSRDALRSTASTGGLVSRTLARAGLVGLAQAVAVVALLHTALGVSWTVLPQTLAFAALLVLAFTAIHAFLSVALGRAGMLVSLVVVALQLAASGGLYPVEVLSGPFQAISPFLPLTWAVQGMQAIVAGAGGGAVGTAAGMVALFGLAGLIGTAMVVARRRGIRSIGFASAALG